MNSETVDLIYLDPPFNSNANYAAPIGSEAAGAEFKDTWGLSDINLAWCEQIKDEHPGLHTLLLAVKQIHGDSMMAYLIYMTPRMIEMKRLLKTTGSIYLHCDPHASHYLKAMMDTIFGVKNFRNEIVWHYYSGGASTKAFARKHDLIFFYSKSSKYGFNSIKEKKYVEGKKKGNEKLKNTTRQWLEDEEGTYTEIMPRDVWYIPIINPMAKERTRYPTQKPLALLQKIIEASSRPNDKVLDPFCGCATACIAAAGLARQWIGIDISPKAADLVKLRMAKEMPMLTYNGVHRTDIPERTDLGEIPKYNSPENKNFLFGKQRGHCRGCFRDFAFQNLTVDHIVPRSKGGPDHISNLQLLCAHCNSMKGHRPQEYLANRLEQLGFIDEIAKMMLKDLEEE